ncbi:cytochrome c [Tabrizicola sp.]|jgi:cytochrome c556|uniref:c-type cytochrome n=1 Tax=Tabrizicola sp. TaxID=2005166 RepID=UPI001A3770FB|nr:cytochrome c [Tabrizicola sp.]MBL9075693.1 cytochrome c [Tabrizicola sp.]
MKFAKALIIGATLSAGAAFAEEERTDPNAIAREELMETIGKNVGIIGDMAGGKTAFDAAAAEGAKAALVEATGKIEATFKDQGAADPASEAKPEIWANWDDFLKKAKAANDAAGALDVASVDTIKAGMGALGGACKDCHTTYRIMKE